MYKKYICYIKMKQAIKLNTKTNIMTTITLTPAQYIKKVELGYFEPIECISIWVKKVKHNLCGRSEIILVNLK